MMPKKKKAEVSGPGKAQCSSVRDYQDKDMGTGGLGNRGREEGLWGFWRGRKGEIT